MLHHPPSPVPLFKALLATALIAAAPSALAQSLDQMAGQMIIVGFAGDDAGDRSVIAIRDEIAAGTLGGVMYLKSNVGSLDRVRAMNAMFRAAAPDLPPFLALDQEGGAVERLTAEVGFTELPNARDVAAANTPAQAEALYSGMAEALADLGFTVNFGPVVDLDLNPDNQIIARYGRAFGTNARTVTAYAQAFIDAHRAAGLLTALKHFPGHGSSTADSHEGFVDITKTWKEEELDPYRSLIAAGYADFVMVGHLVHRAYTQSTELLPASLSEVWVTNVLRGQLGFGGVIISDDLEMGAIREHYDLRDTVVRAVNAGIDVLLFSNTASYDPALAARVRAILVSEAQSDPTFRARIEASYARIVALKQRSGE